jgi:membrane protein
VPSATDLLARLKASRPYGAWKRYGDANGDLLAAGIGYFAFFSIFPAVALGFTVFGFVLRGRPDLLETIAGSLNQTLPGMVRTTDHPEGIISLSPPESATLTITGIVSLVTLLLSGLGWIGALRTGIRGIFGLDASPGNLVTTKVRDLGVLVTLGVGVAASALLSSALGGLTDRVAEWIGLPGQGLLVSLVGLAIGLAFDTVIMVVLLRLLSGVPLPWRNVREGAIVGAALLTLLKFLGGTLIAHATRNPLLGAVAVSVGLLFWLNLISRVVLLAAAWSANRLDVARIAAGGSEPTWAGAARPAFLASLGARADVSSPPYGAGPSGARAEDGARAATSDHDRGDRATDRLSLAAGAVIGAAGAAAVAGARRLRRR